jgi:hypothetical protein
MMGITAAAATVAAVSPNTIVHEYVCSTLGLFSVGVVFSMTNPGRTTTKITNTSANSATYLNIQVAWNLWAMLRSLVTATLISPPAPAPAPGAGGANLAKEVSAVAAGGVPPKSLAAFSIAVVAADDDMVGNLTAGAQKVWQQLLKMTYRVYTDKQLARIGTDRAQFTRAVVNAAVEIVDAPLENIKRLLPFDAVSDNNEFAVALKTPVPDNLYNENVFWTNAQGRIEFAPWLFRLAFKSAVSIYAQYFDRVNLRCGITFPIDQYMNTLRTIKLRGYQRDRRSRAKPKC